MENDILDALNDLGYTGPILEECRFEKAMAGGPKSLDYTSLVEWLANELKVLCQLDEHVHAITTPDDSSSFLLELSSFLKELGCAYTCLTEGHLSERLNTQPSRALLLDYLLTELEAARMIRVNKPTKEKCLKVSSETKTALDLKSMLMALKFPKPPAQITPPALFGKVENKLKEAINAAPKELVGTPIFTGVLSASQWETLADLQAQMLDEYRIRRQMLIKRLDVTIQSFQWSERVRSQEDRIATLYRPLRQAMLTEPDVSLVDLLAARDDVAVIEKTSSSSVRRNTQSAVNKVIIGRVPDRGGRPADQKAPAPEMPSWQKNRIPGDVRVGGGDRGGGERGSRVQGNWNRGQDNRGGGGGNQNRSYQDNSSGYQGPSDNRGGGGGWGRGGGRGGGRGNRGGNRGGYQQQYTS